MRFKPFFSPPAAAAEKDGAIYRNDYAIIVYSIIAASEIKEGEMT